MRLKKKVPALRDFFVNIYHTYSPSAFFAKKKVKEAISAFGIQLAMNITWSFAFFGLKSPLLGMITIIVLWFSITTTMVKFRRISKNAFYLLVPYILWVSFAAILNLSILILN